MFLDVGDKVKKCRKLYAIRQNDFKPFGVSQHYLSMIEGHKRQPTLEMIDRIYDAFYELTDGKIQRVYSKETFKETPDEQVYQYLLKKSREGNIEKHYEQSIILAKQYHLSDIVYELNFQMGTYARKRLNYDTSTEYFIDAIQGGNHDNELLFRCYREIAFNMKQTQSYKSGVLYYKLTLKYMNPIHTILRYRFLYNLAHMYIGLDDYEQAISQLDEIIEHCESVETKAGSILLKCHAYMNQAEYHRAIQLLNEYVESKLYDPYLGMVYYNLARGYYEIGEFTTALEMLEKAFLNTREEQDITSTILKGKIYRKLGRYQEAEQDFLQIKEATLNSGMMRYVQDWYDASVSLYYEQGQWAMIEALFIEMQTLTHKKQLLVHHYDKIKLNLLTQCIKDQRVLHIPNSLIYDFPKEYEVGMTL